MVWFDFTRHLLGALSDRHFHRNILFSWFVQKLICYIYCLLFMHLWIFFRGNDCVKMDLIIANFDYKGKLMEKNNSTIKWSCFQWLSFVRINLEVFCREKKVFQFKNFAHRFTTAGHIFLVCRVSLTSLLQNDILKLFTGDDKNISSICKHRRK